MADNNNLKKGDEVSWNTPQGETTGKIEKKITKPSKIRHHHIVASKDNPEYIVKSDKSGKEAAHKPEGLHEKE